MATTLLIASVLGSDFCTGGGSRSPDAFVDAIIRQQAVSGSLEGISANNLRSYIFPKASRKIEGNHNGKWQAWFSINAAQKPVPERSSLDNNKMDTQLCHIRSPISRAFRTRNPNPDLRGELLCSWGVLIAAMNQPCAECRLLK